MCYLLGTTLAVNAPENTGYVRRSTSNKKQRQIPSRSVTKVTRSYKRSRVTAAPHKVEAVRLVLALRQRKGREGDLHLAIERGFDGLADGLRTKQGIP